MVLKNYKIILLLFGYLMFFYACSNEYDSVTYNNSSIFDIYNKIYTPTMLHQPFTPLIYDSKGRLFYLCKIWGLLKYYHPKVECETSQLDNLLLSYVQKVNQNISKEDFNILLEEFIGHYGSISDSIRTQHNNEQLPVYNSWICDSIYLNKNLNTELRKIAMFPRTTPSCWVTQSGIGVPEFEMEKEYQIENYPNPNLQFLGLCRYWNVINYFYVYKNDMDENWDRVLHDMIYEFLDAPNVKLYHLAILKLAKKLNDCHSMIRSQVLDKEFFGRNVPNYRVLKIDSSFIISQIRVKNWDNEDVRVGDIVLKINDKPIASIYDSLSIILGNSSNKWTAQRDINPYILCTLDSSINFTLLRQNSIIFRNIKVIDYSNYYGVTNNQTDSNLYDLLNDSTVYINLDLINKDNFDQAFNPIKNIPKLIIDLRNYPNNGVFAKLCKFILDDKYKPFVNFTYPDMVNIGSQKLLENNVVFGSQNPYKGKVNILVNEYTQSHAEFLVMALQTSSNVKVFGNISAGSDGNITQLVMPSGVKTIFSGIGVYYPDNRKTQRIGVKIDKIITPTIKGIQQGRDEILECAIKN